MEKNRNHAPKSAQGQTANKPSDFNLFCVTVYTASSTKLDFEQYVEFYFEILRLLFWNPNVDTQIALSEDSNPSGVVLKGIDRG